MTNVLKCSKCGIDLDENNRNPKKAYIWAYYAVPKYGEQVCIMCQLEDAKTLDLAHPVKLSNSEGV